ncbi:hypothetical protein C6P45_000365 [Maudiozyma exigua]|uniref:N-acetyltransferase domain-containing protein n=1 Tax=Maudiozyma exigua TaxID=34358 RepID=A0A9P6WDQ9_MAUEX|nr:hypothetical protein C6P45_000365 [Kazachstania exigua]
MNKVDDIRLYDVNSQNWRHFQQFANRILKTQYPDSLFRDFDNHEHLVYIAKLAMIDGIPIAGLKAYSIISNDRGRKSRILPTATYIETLVVDETYQGKGLGSRMLQIIEQESLHCFIGDLMLHTPVNNSKTIQWYLSKGFIIKDTIISYYNSTDVDPSHSRDAYLLQKTI